MEVGGTAPQRLRTILETHVGSAERTQKPIRWPRERWLTWLPEYVDILQRVPSDLDRAAVRVIAEEPRTSQEAIRGFLAAMVWGYGRTGYGPWRVRQALDGRPDLPVVLLKAATVAQNDAVAAYRILAAYRPPRIGPAFATKYLYFCVPESESAPLILDRFVANWLRAHAGLPLNPVPWAPMTYERYLTRLRTWALELDASPAQVEELIFRDTAGGQGSDPLRP